MIQDRGSVPAWGAWPVDTGQVRFALWAPQARSVELLLDEAAPQALSAQGDGFFTATVPATAG
ncbi:malto-oligosyltrehalose trehalohydrolase, partial [Xanthomonas sp. Kuri4-2]